MVLVSTADVSVARLFSFLFLVNLLWNTQNTWVCKLITDYNLRGMESSIKDGLCSDSELEDELGGCTGTGIYSLTMIRSGGWRYSRSESIYRMRLVLMPSRIFLVAKSWSRLIKGPSASLEISSNCFFFLSNLRQSVSLSILRLSLALSLELDRTNSLWN